jgi:hypothetical protein
MATTAGHRLALDPMGKCSNAFFSETTNMIKAKLYMNAFKKTVTGYGHYTTCYYVQTIESGLSIFFKSTSTSLFTGSTFH